MLSSSGHKINGPKGIGCLYIRKGLKLRSFVHGGAQERKRRAGTENVPGIVGYGVAAERALRTMEERTAKVVCLCFQNIRSSIFVFIYMHRYVQF